MDIHASLSCRMIGFFLLVLTACQDKSAENLPNLVQHVNPLIGTESSFEFSNGNTYPATAVPFGMNFWTPQTGNMGDGWIYTYNAEKIQGFKCTHQPSPWVNDYGCFSLMPVVGDLKVVGPERAAFFDHNLEESAPHHYKVTLDDYQTTLEMSPTNRAASFKIKYPNSDEAFLLFDAFDGGSFVRVYPEEQKVVGFSRHNHGGVPDNFATYFVATFDQPIEGVGTWANGLLRPDITAAEGNHVIAYVRFKTQQDNPVQVNVATSFISEEQAWKNLADEVGEKSFEEVKQGAYDAWNTEMNRILVEGGTEDQKTIFYTALYRTLLFPRTFYEPDSSGTPIYYSPYDGQVHEGYMLTDNGFWDTFRAVHPFFTLMYPDVSSKVMKTLVNTYEEGGWLPSWSSPGYRNIMIGAHSASLIADAYTKGIRNFDIDKAYEAMKKDCFQQAPMDALGRSGFKEYNEKGYVSVEYRESAAKTLEYAYDDYCIMRVAQLLDRPDDVATFRKRALNYRHVFDTTVNFMRGRLPDGSWLSPFDPIEWGGPFTEGSSWHYTWSVFQDPQGLIDLMGGEDTFVDKLDSVFSTPPDFKVGSYRTIIHEMREMVKGDMGQYAHGNQPIQHMIYLYNYAGQPWKTQKWVRETMDKLYGPGPDGLCGDEDNGQTSAWYVFSALGFYPVCPGSTQYVLGSPVFDKVTLKMPTGNELVIKAAQNSPENVYIQRATLNGEAFSKTWLEHSTLQEGGELVFKMGRQPAKDRGVKPEDRPFSLSSEYYQGTEVF